MGSLPNTESSDTQISDQSPTVQKSPVQESSFLNDIATKLNQEINISTETAKIGMFGVGVGSLFGGVAVGMKSATQKDEKAYQEALYAISGFTALCLGTWLAMGRPTLKEFTRT